MIIGVPKELKEHEYRIGITPAGVSELLKEGHSVMVEKSAGMGSGFSDQEYKDAGAEISDKVRIFNNCELIVKVKEPMPAEYETLKEGTALFTFLHLASIPELVNVMLEKNIAGFAYETLEEKGRLPLLEPMSEIAGKMAPLMGAYYLQKIHGGEGLLLTGAGSVSPADVVILGAGSVGMNALKVTFGMGANITVINRGMEKLRRIDEIYEGKVRTVSATKENIEAEVKRTDILIGAVLVAGAKTPRLVTRDLVSRMKNGAVIVDVSVDQGGCIETTRPTTHTDPVYKEEGVIHYCVSNMPGAYPRTSTLALAGSTLKYIKLLARMGIEKAAEKKSPLRTALNTYKGAIIHSAVAEAYSAAR
jgi:alanine dehydrogenase